MCNDPGDGEGAVRVNVKRKKASNSTEISYICRPGLEVKHGSLEISCVFPGNWTSSPPRCLEPQDANFKAYVIGGSVAAVFVVLMLPLLVDFIRFQRKRAKIKENTQRRYGVEAQERSRPSVFFVYNIEPATLISNNRNMERLVVDHRAKLTHNGDVERNIADETVIEKPKKKKKTLKNKKKKKKKQEAEEGIESPDDGGFKSSRRAKKHSGKRVSPFEEEDDMGDYLEEVSHRSRNQELPMPSIPLSLPPAPMLQSRGAADQGQYLQEPLQHAHVASNHTAHSLIPPQQLLATPRQIQSDYLHQTSQGGTITMANENGAVYQIPVPLHQGHIPMQPIQPVDHRSYPSHQHQIREGDGAFPETLRVETETIADEPMRSIQKPKNPRPLPPRPAQGRTNLVFKSAMSPR